MAADPTPTTVGIIQGDVRLESDKFFLEVDRVRAAIRELKDDDPHVRVDADTGDAMARLAEVEAASEAVGGGRTITVDANGTPRVSSAEVDRAEAQAAMDLARARVLAATATEALNAAEAEHTGEPAFQGDTLRPVGMGAGPDTSMMSAGMQDLSVASEDVAKATDDAAQAAKREEVVLDGLDAAAKHVAGSLGGFEEAQKKAANASKNGGGGAGYMGIIVGLIAALVPMIAPLGGYLVGVAGGFTAMGGAGVLAVIGVMKAMQEGTAVGNAYRAGLSTLGDGLDRLAATAAKATLPGFTQSVGIIQAALPGLNSEVGTFGSLLGGTVASAVKTVLDVMTALAPAFQTGAEQVQAFVSGLDGWATGADGARAFGSYMVGVMPQVGAVLNHIITTVGLLVTELAPLGSTMLGIVNVAMGLVNVAEGLGPAFAPAVAAALALWGAMKGWGLLAPLLTSITAALGPVSAETAIWVEALATSPGILTAMATGEAEAATGAMALGGAIDFATGPIGWIVGLIGALAAGLLVAASATNTAATATEDYTAAVQQDNGVIGENTRQQAANALQKNGAAAAGAKLGLSLKTLTDAATGNTAAQQKVTAATKAADDATTKLYGTRRYGTVVAQAENQQNGKAATLVAAQVRQVKDAVKAYNDLQDALGGTSIKTGAQLRAQEALAAKYGEDLPTYLAAVDTQKQQATQAAAARAAMVQESDAAGLLKSALDILNGKTLGVAQAQTGAAAATNSLMDSLKQNGTAIDGNTKKAVSNQQAIQQVIQANQIVAEAIGTATHSSKDAAASYEASKQAMEDNLRAAGLLTPAMKRYIDKLYDLKNLHVPRTKLDVDNSQALTAIQQVMDGISALPGTSTPSGTPSRMLNAMARAYGGSVGHMAAGGTPGGDVSGPGSALSDSAGLFYLANGEFIVSNRNGQADAWRPLLKAINSGDFKGVRLGSKTESGPSTIKTVNLGGIHLHSPVAQDPVAAAEDASQMIVAYAGFPL